MFIKLFSIEWTRLTRTALFWITLAACALFIGFGQQNFYTADVAGLTTGTLKMPSFSFDIANSLDPLIIVALPFLVLIGALMMGNDYSQRTNQHWLMRASHYSSLLAKFAVLITFTFLLQVLAMLVGGLLGWYFKTFIYHTFNTVNFNWFAALAAPFYMTLAILPYLALILFVTVATRSTFAAIAIGLGYTQFIEFIFSGIFSGAEWTKWIPRSLYDSSTYLLNSIGNRVVEIPQYYFPPVTAFVLAGGYTLLLLSLAVWLYNRQDAGG